jgi:UDP-N-acetylmuramoyl-L-alanyl-D-glutamate--2,6-diaminopimelate ligase
MLRQLVPQSIKNLYHWCVALVAVACFGYPSRKLTVIGVTGTDGKTTTANCVYQILLRTGHRVALISTVGAFIGTKRLDLGFHVTTPSPLKLQALLARIKKAGYRYVVLEATSHGFDQHRLLGTNISYAIITNVTPEHLDYHRTFDRYLQAKTRIFNKAKTVILNRDDASFPALKAMVPKGTQVITYSLENLTPFAREIKKIYKEPYNQANMLATIRLAQALKIGSEPIRDALGTPVVIPGRMEVIGRHHQIIGIVDFAHTPNALKLALESAKQNCPGRLIAVFGAAGLRDYFKRPLMGEIAASIADLIVVTAEDPRTENVESIIYQIKQGVRENHHKLLSISDRSRAIHFAARKLAKPGDIVIVLGKGHETSMNLDGQSEIPWSDRDELRHALQIA